MTESGGGVTSPQKYNPRKKESVGRVLPNFQIKFVDPDTEVTVGPNQTGELCYKSLYMATGYYRNPEVTKRTIDEDGKDPYN